MAKFYRGCVVLSFVMLAYGVAWGAYPIYKDDYGMWSGGPFPRDAYPGYTGCCNPGEFGNSGYITTVYFGAGCQVNCTEGWTSCGQIKLCQWIGTGGACGDWPWIAHTYTVTCDKTVNPQTNDMDLDGVPDAYDEDPYNPPIPDADEDGVPDNLDPWPQDGNLPKGKEWVICGRYVHKSSGCVHTEYCASDGSGYSFYTTNCAQGVDPALTPLGDWWYSIPYNNPPKSWDDIMGPEGGGTADDPTNQTIDGDMGALLREMERNTGVTNSVYQELVDLNLKTSTIGTDVGSIDDKMDITNQKLGEIKTAIEGQSFSSSGIEARLDTSNALLTDIKDKIPEVGEGELPDGDPSAMQDNSDLTDEALGDTRAGVANTLKDFMDGFLASNPVSALVLNSGVEASGGTCSLSVSAGQFSFALNFCGFEDTLGMVGTLFVALCALAGIIVVLRD